MNETQSKQNAATFDQAIKLTYLTREGEDGVSIGHWTGERDVWGKRTFEALYKDSGLRLYLFDDEVVSEESWGGDTETIQQSHGPDPSIKDALARISEVEYPETVKYLRHALHLLAASNA